MNEDRLLLELIARAEAIVVFYRPAGRGLVTRSLMGDEVRDVFADARRLVGGGDAARWLEPFREGLAARYGPSEADRLAADFVASARAPGVDVRPARRQAV